MKLAITNARIIPAPEPDTASTAVIVSTTPNKDIVIHCSTNHPRWWTPCVIPLHRRD